MIDNIIKGIDKVGSIADDNIFSEQERAEMLTRRLEIDANSDNQLAKMIRPLITLVACTIWMFMHIAVVFREVPAEALYSADAVLMTCIGFYFDARRREKVNQRKAMAAIKIEEKKLQIEEKKVDQEKFKTRRELRLERLRIRRNKD